MTFQNRESLSAAFFSAKRGGSRGCPEPRSESRESGTSGMPSPPEASSPVAADRRAAVAAGERSSHHSTSCRDRQSAGALECLSTDAYPGMREGEIYRSIRIFPRAPPPGGRRLPGRHSGRCCARVKSVRRLTVTGAGSRAAGYTGRSQVELGNEEEGIPLVPLSAGLTPGLGTAPATTEAACKGQPDTGHGHYSMALVGGCGKAFRSSRFRGTRAGAGDSPGYH
jgi:hypothetical protein